MKLGEYREDRDNFYLRIFAEFSESEHQLSVPWEVKGTGDKG